MDEEEFLSLPFEQKKRKFFELNQVEQPAEIRPVPRFKKDLEALKQLFRNSSPTLRLIRGIQLAIALFGFGDASGSGFGSSWESSTGTAYRFGTWGKEMSSESSNLREFQNLVDTLETMSKQEELEGVEFFLFTDNSTAEAAYFNGSSSNEKTLRFGTKSEKNGDGEWHKDPPMSCGRGTDEGAGFRRSVKRQSERRCYGGEINALFCSYSSRGIS